ncbi:grainyhead-like [Actinomortierella ambigua]|nr:grainyhead-like [Actinomortierella ambigua]
MATSDDIAAMPGDLTNSRRGPPPGRSGGRAASNVMNQDPSMADLFPSHPSHARPPSAGGSYGDGGDMFGSSHQSSQYLRGVDRNGAGGGPVQQNAPLPPEYLMQSQQQQASKGDMHPHGSTGGGGSSSSSSGGGGGGGGYHYSSHPPYGQDPGMPPHHPSHPYPDHARMGGGGQGSQPPGANVPFGQPPLSSRYGPPGYPSGSSPAKDYPPNDMGSSRDPNDRYSRGGGGGGGSGGNGGYGADRHASQGQQPPGGRAHGTQNKGSAQGGSQGQHSHQPPPSQSQQQDKSMASSPVPSDEGSNLRYRITLKAQTAAMQRQDETPVTYLNKGQHYTIALHDTEGYRGDITSVVKVMFHDPSHRKLAARYWSFWLSQQQSPKTARALDIDRSTSTGVFDIQTKTFDRISFKWNGAAGAKVMIRFNCLSTDFSRIKGVKGIPLRVHMDTCEDGSVPEEQTEHSFVKIKLFRDKGAERKNKDDHKHLEKMWDKMRGKNADTNPLLSMLAPVRSVSVFTECSDDLEGSGDEETLGLSETLALDTGSGGDVSSNNGGSGGGGGGGGTDVGQSGGTGGGSDGAAAAADGSMPSPTLSVSGSGMSPMSVATVSRNKRRRGTESAGSSGSLGYADGSANAGSAGAGSGSGGGAGVVAAAGGGGYGQVGALTNKAGGGGGGGGGGYASAEMFLDRDPTYVPQPRKKKAVLCLYIKIEGESVYRAVYLERLTLADLTHKLAEKLEIQSSTVSSVFRRPSKKELMVRVDDAMVAHMQDEQDMVVEYDFNQLDGSVNLTLKY